MQTPQEAFDALLSRLQSEGIRIVDKTGWFWEFMHYFVLIVTFGGNRRFRNYYTTIGPVIGVPLGWEGRSAADKFAVLSHERRHVGQFRWAGLGSAWLGILPAGICYALLPLPVGFAWFRWRMERTAYAEGIRAYLLVDPNPAQRARRIARATKQLTGGAYGWTAALWPGRKRVEAWFQDAVPHPAPPLHLAITDDK